MPQGTVSEWSRSRVVTNLCPDQLHQASNELRRGIHTEVDTLFVDYLADLEPQGGAQFLWVSESRRLLGRVWNAARPSKHRLPWTTERTF